MSKDSWAIPPELLPEPPFTGDWLAPTPDLTASNGHGLRFHHGL
jgi:hypothetical protein